MESSDDSKSFIKHVFNFNDDSKSEILNIVQYALISIIPIVILNKTMQKYVPEAEEEKSSLEILAEIVVQIISMFLGLLLIHRIITFVPTYSGEKYPDFNVIYTILAVLLITLSLQTKMGEKVSLLVERVNELWNGKKQVNRKNGTVKITQPISGQQQQQQQQQQSVYNDGTSINSLPTSDMAAVQNSLNKQQLPNYDKMYRQDNNPLVNASSPDQIESFSEPVAASEFGGGFGSW